MEGTAHWDGICPNSPSLAAFDRFSDCLFLAGDDRLVRGIEIGNDDLSRDSLQEISNGFLLCTDGGHNAGVGTRFFYNEAPSCLRDSEQGLLGDDAGSIESNILSIAVSSHVVGFYS